MNKTDKRFIAIWAKKSERGALQYYIRTTLLTCIISAAVWLYYTWDNIPEGKHIESILPISVLIFGVGIPLGLIISWATWTKNNNKYKFLTKDSDLNTTKKKWHGHDRVWDLAIPNIGAIYFIMLYTSIFLFDSGNPTLLTYSIVTVIISYFIAQAGYTFYRYRIDKQGETKIFPLFFKYTFSIIILLTALLWLLLFFNGQPF